MHSRVWAGEARSGEGTLAPPPFLFGCHESVSSAFRWGGNACVPRRSYASNGNPPVGASVVRSGWVGLHGRPWGGVGTRSPYIDKPNSPGDSQRTTIKAHQTPYLSS